MVEEFKKLEEIELPISKESVYGGICTLSVFHVDEFPARTFGSIERWALSSLGDWEPKMDDDGYGMAYRLATKERVRGPRGDFGKLILMFGMPFKRAGLKLDRSKLKAQYDKLYNRMLDEVVKAATIPETEVVIGLSITPPPDYMMGELEAALNKYPFLLSPEGFFNYADV
jgi:hypothetical protein